MATLIQGTAAADFLIGSEDSDLIITNGGFDVVYAFGATIRWFRKVAKPLVSTAVRATTSTSYSRDLPTSSASSAAAASTRCVPMSP